MFIKTRPGFWKDLWALLKPYWGSKDPAPIEIPLGVGRLALRFSAREGHIGLTLLVVVVGLTLGIVYMNVQFNTWYNAFYNTLQDKNVPEFYYQMLRFLLLATIWIVLAVYVQYLNQTLQIRWRKWMTERYLVEWLADRTYYRLQLANNGMDNPDQRIAEDMRLFVDETLHLSLGLLNALTTLVAFVGILWILSGPFAIPFGGTTINVPGYMVVAAVLYATLGTWITHLIGRSLAPMNFAQQRYEADFRFQLVRFRENVEGIALYRGEADELRGFQSRFGLVAGNWWRIIKRQKLLTWFTSGHGQLAVVFPYLVAAPRFFSGAIQLGGLIQTANAFSQVHGALSWFIDAYTGTGPNTGFVGWKATVDRLTGFHSAIMTAKAQQRENPGVLLEPSEGTGLALQSVNLGLPTGRTLLAEANVEIPEGARVLVRGPSGSGKSTLFRAIAGIWPFGGGRVRLPKNFRALFLPQRPYFPLGPLAAAVSYPSAPHTFSEEQIRDALSAVGLPGLAERTDAEANWSMQLSGGEQQRVAIARALLHKPRWLFMDEATSALDEPAQAELLRLLHDRLPDTTVIGIAHRPALAEHHDRILEIEPGTDGHARLLWEPARAAA